MAKVNSLASKDLSRSDFERYPVWTWSDDKESYVPLSEPEPSPEDYEGLFIKARIEAGGHAFDGYLVGDETYFAFGLFVADREYVLNLNLPKLIDQDLIEIFEQLKCPPFKLFPARYSSTVRLKGRREIAGTLDLK